MESKSQTFLLIPSNTDFSIHNIPFGVFSTIAKPSDLRCASRIGKPKKKLNTIIQYFLLKLR